MTCSSCLTSSALLSCSAFLACSANLSCSSFLSSSALLSCSNLLSCSSLLSCSNIFWSEARIFSSWKVIAGLFLGAGGSIGSEFGSIGLKFWKWGNRVPESDIRGVGLGGAGGLPNPTLWVGAGLTSLSGAGSVCLNSSCSNREEESWSELNLEGEEDWSGLNLVGDLLGAGSSGLNLTGFDSCGFILWGKFSCDLGCWRKIGWAGLGKVVVAELSGLRFGLVCSGWNCSSFVADNTSNLGGGWRAFGVKSEEKEPEGLKSVSSCRIELNSGAVSGTREDGSGSWAKVEPTASGELSVLGPVLNWVPREPSELLGSSTESSSSYS